MSNINFKAYTLAPRFFANWSLIPICREDRGHEKSKANVGRDMKW